MRKTFLFVFAMLVLASESTFAAWGSWDEDISSNTKQRKDALRPAQVVEARVIAVRTVKVTPSQSARALGTAVGTAAGVVVARKIDDSVLGQVAGGVVGGIAAQSVTPAETAHEVMVKYFSPSQKRDRIIAVTTKEAFSPGEKVFLIYDGSGLRLARYQ